MEENTIGTKVIKSAIVVHRALGPGLLESVYETALSYELQLCNLAVRQQVIIPVKYKDSHFDQAFRADIIVEDKVVLEIKSIEILNAVHRKQLQTYLRLSDCWLGYLFNFWAALMRDGIVRAVNGLPE